ncbi:MAG: RNA methyltransferase [Muribaculaceae bacterium]|nr:RNA methyltransferase [Muribaculaceae bacterium]
MKTARHRREAGAFVAEGTRCVLETLPHYAVRCLVATPKWLEENGGLLPAGAPEPLTASADEMRSMSSLQTPQGVLAVYDIPRLPPLELPAPGELCLALDTGQDPGNLGTIVRVASWFGIRRVFASETTVDLYNPKVVQATMGGLAGVEVRYLDLPAFLGRASEAGIPVCGTFLDGSDIYRGELPPGGIIVLGNEGNGVSPEVEARCSLRLKIPSFPPDGTAVESLNVGTAAAVAVAEFRRRIL